MTASNKGLIYNLSPKTLSRFKLNAGLEKTIAVLVIVLFALASTNSLILHLGFITREEAIEISRGTELVQSSLEKADNYHFEARYLNQTHVNKAREEGPWLQKYYPKDASLWVITWYIHHKGDPSAAAHVISHVIDAETGQIFHEGQFTLR